MFCRDILQEHALKVKKVKLITCHLPEAYVQGLEVLCEKEIYPNRSEAIRVAIRDLLKNELGHLVKEDPQ